MNTNRDAFIRGCSVRPDGNRMLHPDQGSDFYFPLITMISAVFFKFIRAAKYSTGSLTHPEWITTFIVVKHSRIRH